MVDPQIGGDLLVGGRAVRALPFDQPWWATAQALVTASKDASVVPCGGENIGVLLGGECLVESVINDVIDVGDEPGPRRQRSFEITETEEPETGDDLADFGAEVSHGSVGQGGLDDSALGEEPGELELSANHVGREVVVAIDTLTVVDIDPGASCMNPGNGGIAPTFFEQRFANRFGSVTEEGGVSSRHHLESQHAVQEFEIFGKKDRWRLVVNDGVGNGGHGDQVGRERAASYRPISASDQNPGLGKTAPPSA